MKECDIFQGVKTYSDPSCIFSRGCDPQSPGSTPLRLYWLSQEQRKLLWAHHRTCGRRTVLVGCVRWSTTAPSCCRRCFGNSCDYLCYMSHTTTPIYMTFIHHEGRQLRKQLHNCTTKRTSRAKEKKLPLHTIYTICLRNYEQNSDTQVLSERHD